jgi:NADPH-dependent curcumin reductase CurA
LSRRVTLAARPVGEPKESDFSLEDGPTPAPEAGEVLVRTLWASVDPYQRGRMSTRRSYARHLELGDVVTAQAVGEVAESRDSRYSAGDLVVGQLGWQEHAVVRGGSLRRVPPELDPPSLALHAVGATGFTAYFGLLDVGRPRPGDTVVVSGAAGAVGSVAGQIAKLAGCRTVGIAGGAEKGRDLRDLYGFDAAIDYKAEDVRTALKAACPDGVDVYFDNVGGETTQAIVPRLNVGARIVICGQVSQYNLEQPEPGPGFGFLIVFRARVEGFLVNDYVHRFGEAAARLGRWVSEGKIRWREHVTDGLENAPRAFIGMLRGENRGKALVKVVDRSS